MCACVFMCVCGESTEVKKLNRSEQDESHTNQEIEGHRARMRAIVKKGKKRAWWMDDVGEWIRGLGRRKKKGKARLKTRRLHRLNGG